MKKRLRQRDAFRPAEYAGAPSGWRARVHEIIFGIDTPAGRAFDIGLVAAILLSILVVVLDSVPAIGGPYAQLMYALEWFFTLLFTIEYAARLATLRHPLRYAMSFYGLIDLLSVLPTYISLLVPGSEAAARVQNL
jgi:voltage-gated potassium channel